MVDLSVAGVQTCALPICMNGTSTRQRLEGRWVNTMVFTNPIRFEIRTATRYDRSEERREGEDGRSQCGWSSDVCSSDLYERHQHQAKARGQVGEHHGVYQPDTLRNPHRDQVR